MTTEAPIEPESTTDVPAAEDNLAALSAEELAEMARDLQARLEQAEAKVAENLDGWQRARAEFANYKRRTDGEFSRMRENVTADVVTEFLTVMDDLDMAISTLPDTPEAERWTNGVILVQRKMAQLLEKLDVYRIPAVGEEFDPTLHEAVMQDNTPDFESGQVTAVLREGYRMGERVLRPSMVKVAN